MDAGWNRARLDWLIELGGASALGLAAAYAGSKLAPSLALAAPTAMGAAGIGCFALGMLVMRTVPADPAMHALADFSVEPIQSTELLLETVAEEPLLLDIPLEEPGEDNVLLLDDPLPEADPASRVVQLFALPPMPTPAELKDRIDRHLAGAPNAALSCVPPAQPDAARELFDALDKLRRSLR